ncbi:DeoR/GlpR family DNA-binding transcription regulator [Nonomuraea roseoviolacea subsp. roseoviolacea]|uniref:DeoR/GlpR family transcriptional regulator of sugar metabolism n=1 Tax=Nonomuraea roseoviolacea subsp. carminata TaxID=160689 RepID=A0ABT1KBM3_9ACTN|nr:DeoR/GlpR family DNA-binding transcription regulator [Nonomuraea roseoviolacea]MCP2351039.1 DeoR/GlpR family transcriptional regulator of sugar metabolism [Nonomuraea roseoviolacea subsp. carminata]
MIDGGGTRPGPARRQEAIAEQILARGDITAGELAELFQVSLMTIHRDLSALERQGLVRKLRGGVTAQPSSVFESDVSFRERSMRAEKEAVAARAAELVEPGMAVMLDDSTTSLALARRLEALAPLTVVTNFLTTIELVAGMPGIRLIALGGDYDAPHNSFLGVSCTDAIAALQADLCFVSTSAVTGGHACHQEQHIVPVKRAMLASATRGVLLLDHTKLTRTALYRVARLETFDRVIVDAGAAPEALRELDQLTRSLDVAALLPPEAS